MASWITISTKRCSVLTILARLGVPLWVVPVAGIAIGATGSWWITSEIYKGRMATLERDMAEAKADALDIARKKDAENARLAADADLSNAKAKDALDRASDAARAAARDHGLYVKTKRECVPVTPSNPGGSEDGTTEARLSDETADALITFARDADRAAIYANTCHAWALRALTP